MKIALGQYTIEEVLPGSFEFPEDVLHYFDADNQGSSNIKGYIYEKKVELFLLDIPNETGAPAFEPLTIKAGVLSIPDEWCSIIAPGPYHLSGSFTRWYLNSIRVDNERIAESEKRFKELMEGLDENEEKDVSDP